MLDLESGLLLAAEVNPANAGDTTTIEPSLTTAEVHMGRAGKSRLIQEVVADKGYHGNESLATLTHDLGCRTYIPEPQGKHRRTWTDKPEEQRTAVYANRRRTRGVRGQRLQRERSFAHVCETGAARRTWIRGRVEVAKRYAIAAAAHNLGCLMRTLFNM